MINTSDVPEWANVATPAGARRLPVYLLLDCSTSMQGAPIDSVYAGLEQFKTEIEADPHCQELVHVGVIAFASDGELRTNGLEPIATFEPPLLIAEGVTRLDLAFSVLADSIDRDVRRPIRGGQKGDFKPMVFVLTDGNPTDELGRPSDAYWPAKRDALLNRPTGTLKPAAIVAVGCGPNVMNEKLKAISTGVAFRMGTRTPSGS